MRRQAYLTISTARQTSSELFFVQTNGRQIKYLALQRLFQETIKEVRIVPHERQLRPTLHSLRHNHEFSLITRIVSGKARPNPGRKDATPERVKKGLAKYPIPVFLIARLAVDQSMQGRKLGKRFLRFILKRAAKAANEDIPPRAIVVDAIDNEAKQFYSQFGFTPWPIDGLRMWLLMKDLQATLRSATAADEAFAVPVET